MPLAFVNSDNANNGGAGSSLQCSGIATTTGNPLVVIGRWETNITAASITDTAGNTYTAGTEVTWDTLKFINMFWCLNPTGNANNQIQLNTNATATNRGVIVAQYSGFTNAAIDANAPPTAGGAGTGTGNTFTSASFSTTTANEILIAGMACSGFQSFNAGSGYTMEASTGGYCALEDQVVSSTQSSVTASATVGGFVTWAMYVVTLYNASAVSSTDPPFAPNTSIPQGYILQIVNQ